MCPYFIGEGFLYERRKSRTSVSGNEGLLALVVQPKHTTMNGVLGARGFRSWQQESVEVYSEMPSERV